LQQPVLNSSVYTPRLLARRRRFVHRVTRPKEKEKKKQTTPRVVSSFRANDEQSDERSNRHGDNTKRRIAKNQVSFGDDAVG